MYVKVVFIIEYEWKSTFIALTNTFGY
jgi:hypothetical protein